MKIFLHDINMQNHKDHVNNSMKLFREQNSSCNSLRHIHHTRICSKRKTKISYPIGFKGHPWTVRDFRRLIVHISYSSPWYHHSITTQVKYFMDMITIWHLIHDWGTTKFIGTFNQLEIRKLNFFFFFVDKQRYSVLFKYLTILSGVCHLLSFLTSKKLFINLVTSHE